MRTQIKKDIVGKFSNSRVSSPTDRSQKVTFLAFLVVGCAAPDGVASKPNVVVLLGIT